MSQAVMPWAARSGERLPNWRTPVALFREIERLYAPGGRFTIDVCADHLNAKCARYITEEQDALLTPWGDPREPTVFWLQPPFDNIGALIRRAVEQMDVGNSSGGVAFVPGRIDRDWWVEVVVRRGIVFPAIGRVTFEPPPEHTGAVSSHAEAMAIVRFERPLYLPAFAWRAPAAIGVADLFGERHEAQPTLAADPVKTASQIAELQETPT